MSSVHRSVMNAIVIDNGADPDHECGTLPHDQIPVGPIWEDDEDIAGDLPEISHEGGEYGDAQMARAVYKHILRL